MVYSPLTVLGLYLLRLALLTHLLIPLQTSHLRSQTPSCPSAAGGGRPRMFSARFASSLLLIASVVCLWVAGVVMTAVRCSAANDEVIGCVSLVGADGVVGWVSVFFWGGFLFGKEVFDLLYVFSGGKVGGTFRLVLDCVQLQLRLFTFYFVRNPSIM